jgi:hypothetical protein
LIRLLHLQVDPGLGEALQDFGEPGDAHPLAAEREAPFVRTEAVARVQRGELSKRVVGDCAAPVRGGVHGLVVAQDDLAVARGVAVRFQVDDAELECALEGRQGVRGRLAARALVGEQMRTRLVEVGMHRVSVRRALGC